jgi:nucleotidyltransferase AbiEii toxin of type IV toxin-antitoxin system
MPADYLHNHPNFADLIRIVAQEKGIDPSLVEKDYWIMHCLYGLQKLNMKFELKGGTSLSKGHKIVGRFSEDIDIRIEPPAEKQVATRKNQTSATQVKSRKDFYDWLATTIKIDGISEVARDTAYDNPNYFSGGIRLSYKGINKLPPGLSDGVLLELGFDDVTPNEPKDISSWVYDYAATKGVDIIDNRAKGVACYDARYTFVEKLQTVSTKFRLQQEKKDSPVSFMRHYYDVYELLGRSDIQEFIGTDAYKAHKQKRFRKADNQNIAENQAFVLSDPATRKIYEVAYVASSALYYGSKPTFTQILERIKEWAGRL